MANITPLDLTFVDGQTCSAAQLNSIVSRINELIVSANNNSDLLDTITKSELLVLAVKNTTQTFDGDGQSRVITDWTTKLNKNSIFNAATGVATIPTQGTYTILAKTLVSSTNSTAPRSKLTILGNGQTLGISEDTVFQEQANPVQNYRRNHDANATSQMSPSSPVLLSVQVWGSAQASIFGDSNTVIKIYREIS